MCLRGEGEAGEAGEERLRVCEKILLKHVYRGFEEMDAAQREFQNKSEENVGLILTNQLRGQKRRRFTEM